MKKRDLFKTPEELWEAWFEMCGQEFVKRCGGYYKRIEDIIWPYRKGGQHNILHKELSQNDPILWAIVRGQIQEILDEAKRR